MGKKKIALFLEDNFQGAEAIYPLYRLREAGAEVIVIGSSEFQENQRICQIFAERLSKHQNFRLLG